MYIFHQWGVHQLRMLLPSGPARWEPCGLVQMEAMRLGTLPIVAPTGGLKDTVEAGEMGRNGAGKWPLELVTKWL